MKRSPEDYRDQLLAAESALVRDGDDVLASRTVEIAQLLRTLGESERSAFTFLDAAKHCRTTGQLLRAAVLARTAFRTSAATLVVHDSAVLIWRECSGEPDSEFYADGSSN
jgi:hypothetical protein